MPLTRIKSLGITDGTIVNADINASAAIANTKLSAGAVLQVVSATKTDTSSSSTTSYADITGLSVSITPSSVNNKVLIMFNTYNGSVLNTTGTLIQLVRNSTTICIGDAASLRPRLSGNSYAGDLSPGTQNFIGVVSNTFLDSPNTTSATTYKLQFAASGSGTAIYINRTSSDRDAATYDPRTASTITVMEIAG